MSTTTTTTTAPAPAIQTITLKPSAPAPAPAAPQEVNQDSPFLRLPAELRNEIYSLLLTSPTIPALQRKAARCTTYSAARALPRADIHPAILQTCRQIHAEATPMLYGRNTFAAHPSLLSGLPNLVQPSRPVTAPSVANLIRNWRLAVRLDTDARFSAKDAARAFSGAESLDIEAWQAQFEAADYSVLRLFEEVRGVRRVRVHGSVEPRFARWLELVMMSPEESEDECMGSGASTPAYVEFDGEDGRRMGRGPGGLPLWAH